MSDLFSRLGAAAVRSARPRPVGDPFAVDAAPDRSGPVERPVPGPDRSPVVATAPPRPDPGRGAERHAAPTPEAVPDAAGEVTTSRGTAPDERTAATTARTSPPPTPAPRPEPVGVADAHTADERDAGTADTSPDRVAPAPAMPADRPTPTGTTRDGEAVPGVRSPSVATVVSARRRDPDPIFAAVASDTATSPVADGGPAVRIHIGRLDVRANLESAPSSRPSAQQRRTMPEPVSLDDYLAGRRGRR